VPVPSSLELGRLLPAGLGGLVDEGLVDVRDDTTPGDGGLDEGVELLVTADRELEVAGRDALHLEVLAGVPGQLEDLGGEVLEDRRRVDGRRRTDAVTVVDCALEEPVDPTDGELQSCLARTGLRGLLRGGGLTALATLTAFSTFARLRYYRE